MHSSALSSVAGRRENRLTSTRYLLLTPCRSWSERDYYGALGGRSLPGTCKDLLLSERRTARSALRKCGSDAAQSRPEGRSSISRAYSAVAGNHHAGTPRSRRWG